MPGDRAYRFLPREELLSYEEIAGLTRVFAGLGVEKLRITGGEPLLRRDLDQLIGLLVPIRGIRDIAITTNGAFLRQRLPALKAAGLRRLTVSLDSLDPSRFFQLSGNRGKLEAVLEAIDLAAESGMLVKINTVIQKGINDHEVGDLVAYFKQRNHVIRFIEFMDVGSLNQWHSDRVVPSQDIVEQVNRRFPCEPIPPNYPGEVASRYRFLDGSGEFGTISSVTKPFCGSCSRARVSADGQLYTCLFSNQGTDLKSVLRSANGGDEQLRDLLSRIWSKRVDRYSELRDQNAAPGEKVEMFKIGG